MTTSKQWLRGIVCLGFGFAGLAVPRYARAKGLAGKSELQLRTTLLDYESSSSSSKAVNLKPGQVAPAPSSASSEYGALGLMGSGYGANYGYFLTDHVQVGAGVMFSHNHQSSADYGSSSGTTFMLAPRVEYALSGAAVHPYVAVQGGYQHNWSSSSGSTYNASSEGSGFTFGASVGAHLFVTDSWSLEPELGVQRFDEKGTGSVSDKNGVPAGYDMEDRFKGTTLMLTLGISGWFGGR